MRNVTESGGTRVAGEALAFEYWGRVAYQEALQRMGDVQLARRSGAIPDTICYVEHPPVITFGRTTPPAHLNRCEHGVPVVEVPRGGLATYHGPGQLVGYGIVRLTVGDTGAGLDVGRYLRGLEAGLVDYLHGTWQLPAGTRPGFTGVWVSEHSGPRKIASIGISVRRGVTAHGFALNISTDLSAFDAIVPCGNESDTMTSVQREVELTGDTPYLCVTESLARDVHRYLCRALSRTGWEVA
jgi:lipoate-protein ligase B